MSTSESWKRFTGDTGDTLTGTVEGVDSLVNAVGAEAHIWQPGVAAVTLPVTIVDAVALKVRISLGTWINTAAPGAWRTEVQITGEWSDGSNGPKTFPGPFLVLAAQGA